MKRYPAPKTPESVVNDIRRRAAEGASQQQMIAEMRLAGLEVVPSIMLLSEVAGIDVNEAKRAVHFSPTWDDCLRKNDSFHEAAIKAAKRLGATVVEVELEEEVPLEAVSH